MVGIKDFGSYLPFFRYERILQVKAWDLKQFEKAMVGERTVMNYDEDTCTMAVEAVDNLMAGGHAADSINALYYASTTAPYLEKSTAAIVATACSLFKAQRTADFNNSLRASTAALRAALDAVAGGCNNVMVAAADSRQTEPGFYMESMMGDGAAALLIGKDDVIAEFKGSYHLSQDIWDIWRRKDDRYLNYDDEAWQSQEGYQKMVPKALKGLLEATGLQVSDLAKVVAYAPDGPNYMGLVKKSPAAMVFNIEPLLMTVGNLGTVSPIIQMAYVLEEANPGDKIVMIGYGDGADAFLFEVTEAIKKRKARRGVSTWLGSKGQLPSYTTSLYFRQLFKDKPLWSKVEPWTSLPLLKREQTELLSFWGHKCKKCGTIWWSGRPICYNCGTANQWEDVRLARKGKIASFVFEWAAPTPVVPNGMIVIDLEDGSRVNTALTDVEDPNVIKVGQEVEMCLRVMHEAKKIPHYSWKCRLVRG